MESRIGLGGISKIIQSHPNHSKGRDTYTRLFQALSKLGLDNSKDGKVGAPGPLERLQGDWGDLWLSPGVHASMEERNLEQDGTHPYLQRSIMEWDEPSNTSTGDPSDPSASKPCL